MINWVHQVQMLCERLKNVWLMMFELFDCNFVCLHTLAHTCVEKERARQGAKNDKWHRFQLEKDDKFFFQGFPWKMILKWFFFSVAVRLSSKNLILFWIYIDINNRLQMIGLLNWNVRLDEGWGMIEQKQEHSTHSPSPPFTVSPPFVA